MAEDEAVPVPEDVDALIFHSCLGIFFDSGVGGVEPLREVPVLPEVDRAFDAGGADLGRLCDRALFDFSFCRPRSSLSPLC